MAFIPFAGIRYYPDGGAEDLIGYADSLEEAIDLCQRFIAKQEGCLPWANILDTDKWEMHTWDSDGNEWDITPAPGVSSYLI